MAGTHNDDGWSVIDNARGLCLSWDSKRRALAEAKFCRAYVKKWGDINFNSYPWDMDEEPGPVA